MLRYRIFAKKSEDATRQHADTCLQGFTLAARPISAQDCWHCSCTGLTTG
jgi:hypothetical protein